MTQKKLMEANFKHYIKPSNNKIIHNKSQSNNHIPHKTS